MIKVTRPPAPLSIQTTKIKSLNSELWEHYHKSTQQRMKFRIEVLRSVKEDLEYLFNRKCAFCETRIGVVSDFDIEHFRPKSGVSSKDLFYPQHYFWLTYEWENLFPSCHICNRSKRNEFPLTDESKRAKIGATGAELLSEEPLLLDPCLDDPADHLDFMDNGEVKGLSDRGTTTIEIFNLNRTPLRNERQNAIAEFMQKVRTRFISLEELGKLFSEQTDHQYAGALRAAYRRYLDKMPLIEDSFKIKKESLSALNKEYKEIIKDIEYIQNRRFFTIKSFEIRNFRTISELKVDFKLPESESEMESWLLFLGDNGIGKSSILQALALTLCGKKQFEELAPKVEDYLKRDQKEGHIRIYSYEGENPVELKFDEHGFRGMLEDSPTYLLGYGATRLLPKDGLTYQAPQNPFVNISNLFNYSSPLNDVNQWLSSVDPTIFEKYIAPALFDLLNLQDGEKVAVTASGRLEITQRNGSLDLEKTSDGYKSIIALACDIMKTLSNDPAGYHTVQGIALIDELGNHLHPKWRMKIVQALRTAFPRLQFVVSTHEPLCLRGLQHGEVVVLMEGPDQQVIPLDKDILPDHSTMKVDQLLTSDLFGLLNTFDPQTEKRFNEYYRLLSIPENLRTQEESEQIIAHTRLLSGKEIIGNTPQMQAVYQLVNEKFAQSLVSKDFQTQQQLKEETIQEVRNMLDLDNLEWL